METNDHIFIQYRNPNVTAIITVTTLRLINVSLTVFLNIMFPALMEIFQLE